MKINFKQSHLNIKYYVGDNHGDSTTPKLRTSCAITISGALSLSNLDPSLTCLLCFAIAAAAATHATS